MPNVFELFREPRPQAELEPFGVIDIGSNSVRMVIYEGAVRSAAPLFNEKVLCGLGKQVASTGKLGGDATRQALQALRRFRAITRILGTKNIRAIATAAVREAEDGPEFIAAGEKVCGTKIEILSGSREAELVAQGIRMGFCTPFGIAGDLGGGSLELTHIADTENLGSVTTPLGGLRLIDATGDRIDKASDLIDAELEKIGWLDEGKGKPFYAVGGTWRSLAKMHMELTNYPLRVMQGYVIPTNDAIEFCSSVRKAKKVQSLDGIQAVSRARRDVLPFGAYVLERVLKRIAPSEVVFSVYGIREGTLFDLMPPHEQRKDPLLSFCENYARLRSRSVDHAKELCAWTDMLFTRDDLKETSEERRLRQAACLISDIGWRSHPDYRGEQSLNLIAHAGMAGIDHPGRFFLALAIYYRHVGVSPREVDDLSQRLRTAISKTSEYRARIVGGAIRCAHMLSVGMPGVLDETRLDYQEQGQLRLTLPTVYQDLQGDRLTRRLDTLAGLLDCKAKIEVA